MGLSKRADRAIAFGLLTIWVVYSSVQYWGGWPIDLSALWMAARLVDLGEVAHLYDAPTRIFTNAYPERWVAELEALGHSDKVALPYVYPPIWAWVLSHLGQVDPYSFFNYGQVLLFSSLAMATYLLWRMAGQGAMTLTSFVLATALLAQVTIPHYFAAFLGQPQLFLVFLTILAFERYVAGATRTAAIALGLAAAIKITPILLALVFLAERDWRTTLETVAVAAACAVLSCVVVGIEPHWDFLARLTEISALAPMIGLNVTFETLAHWYIVPLPERLETEFPFIPSDIIWVNVVSKLGLVAAIGLALTAGRGQDLTGRVLLRLMALLMGSLLFGELSWMHYYIIPVMVLPLLPAYIGWTRAALAAIPMLAVLCVPVEFTPNSMKMFFTVYPKAYWYTFFWAYVVLVLPPVTQTSTETGAVPAE